MADPNQPYYQEGDRPDAGHTHDQEQINPHAPGALPNAPLTREDTGRPLPGEGSVTPPPYHWPWTDEEGAWSGDLGY